MGPLVNLTLGLFLRLSTWDPTSKIRAPKGFAWEGEVAVAFLAVRHFNNRDGTVVPALAGPLAADCPIQFVPHVYDSQSHPQPTLDAYLQSRYVDEWKALRPDIVVGASRSASSTPLALLTSLHNVPQISHWSTSKALDDSETYPMFLRTIMSDGLIAIAVAQLFHGPLFEARRVSMIYVNDAYGFSYMEAVAEACTSRDVKFDAYAFSFGDQNSVMNAVERMADADARYIVAVVFDDDLEFLMRTAAAHGIAGSTSHLWMFTDSAQNFNGVDENVRQAFDGALRVLSNGKGPDFPGWVRLSQSWQEVANSDAESFVSYINAHLPPLNITDPSFQFQLDPNIFDTPLAERNDAGGFADGTPFLYDAISSMGLAACAAEKAASEAGAPFVASETGKAIQTAALRQSFDAVSGTIEYNEFGSRSATTARVELYNLRSKRSGDVSMVLVGAYDKGNWTLKSNADGSRKVIFSGGSSKPPPWRSPPVINRNLIAGGLRLTMYIFVGLEVMLALLCGMWTCRYWNTPIVRASQPIFLLLICLGTIISTFAIVPLSFDNNDGNEADTALHASCRAIAPVFSIGFCITFASLFAKQFRVWWVFQRAAKMKRVANKKDQTLCAVLSIVGVVVAMNAIILILWDALAPLQWVVTPLQQDDFGVVVSSVVQCRAANDYLSNMLGSTVLAFLFALILLGNAISCKTKELPTQYQESKWIGYSMISTFQVFAIGLPLMILTTGTDSNGSVSASFATRSAFVILNNSGVLLFIFGPKIGEYYKLGRKSKILIRSIRSRRKIEIQTPKEPTAGSDGEDLSTRELQSQSTEIYKSASQVKVVG